MTLPSRLARYSSLLDLLVDELLREIEQGIETEAPRRSRLRRGAIQHHDHDHDHERGDNPHARIKATRATSA